MPKYRLVAPMCTEVHEFAAPHDFEALSWARRLAATFPSQPYSRRATGSGGFHLERRDVSAWQLVQAWVPRTC